MSSKEEGTFTRPIETSEFKTIREALEKVGIPKDVAKGYAKILVEENAIDTLELLSQTTEAMLKEFGFKVGHILRLKNANLIKIGK
jgi:hypothetical protein